MNLRTPTSIAAAAATSAAAAPAATPSANTYSNVNALSALKKDPNSPQAIHAVAQQVDALFLQMMLKSMRDAASDVGEQQSNEMGIYQDMFDKQVSLSLSQHHDLGLGAQLTRQMAALAAGGAAASTAVTVATAATAATAPSAAASASTAEVAATPAEFVDRVYPAIQRAAQALGVSPLGLLAQAALETGWGRRMARTADGSPSLNLFGIKADEHWSGAKAAADTVEFSGGVAVPKRAAFRAYSSIDAGVNDYAQLIGTAPRYQEAVAQGADPQAYVQAIGRSGYATDPAYAEKLHQMLNSSAFQNVVRRSNIVL